MEQSNAPSTPARPGLLSVLCILSMIGTGLLSLFSLIGIFASSWVMGLLGQKMGEVAKTPEMQNAMADSANGANVKAGMEAASGFMAMGTGILIAVFVILLILNVLKFMGAMKMYGQKKSGFWMYMVPALIMLLLSVIGFNIIGIIIFGLFIGGFFSVKKALI